MGLIHDRLSSTKGKGGTRTKKISMRHAGNKKIPMLRLVVKNE